MNVVERYGLVEPINATGAVTALGATRVGREVVAAMADALPRAVDMVQLQERACAVIRRVMGTEAGCVTACAASAVVVGVAACMTGCDMAKVEELPDGRNGKDEVVLQRGHSAWFGVSVRQMIRLAGARVVEIGDVKRAGAYQLKGAIGDRTVAGLYVVSHHASAYDMISLEAFCSVAHAHGVPVIVDAAAEARLEPLIEQGADLICVSGHKSIGGPTSGILAGRAALVEAALLHQYHGIGRAMKVGKESIVGVMCALEEWAKRDIRAEEDLRRSIVDRVMNGLEGALGLRVTSEQGRVGSYSQRVRIFVDAVAAELSAYDIATALASGSPPLW